MKLLRLILILVLFCSCSTLKKSVKPESFIELTPANIGLINGRYEVNSTRNIRSNVDDLHWIIFDRGYNKKNSTEFIKLKSLSCKKILITHYDGDSIVKSKIFHDGWEIYYPQGDEDYSVLRFVPHKLKTYSNFRVASEDIK